MDPLDPRHGEERGYTAGCREACCRSAHSRAYKQRRNRKYLGRIDSLLPDATPTHRRIQALMAIGWKSADLDDAVGRRKSHTFAVLNRSTVTIATARMYADLYNRLCMTNGPSEITRTRSLRRGWVPPLAWDNIDDPDETPSGAYRPRNPFANTGAEPYDEATVIRILSGDWRLPCTPADKREVVARWTLRDPMRNSRGVHENEWDRPSYAYLERLTGWKVDRYHLPTGAA